MNIHESEPRANDANWPARLELLVRCRVVQGVPRKEALRPEGETNYQPAGWFFIAASS